MISFLLLMSVITGFLFKISPISGLFFLFIIMLIAVKRRVNKIVIPICTAAALFSFFHASNIIFEEPPESIDTFKVVDYKYYRDSISYIVESGNSHYDLYSESSLSIGDVCRGGYKVNFPGTERNYIKKNEQLRLLMNGINGRIYEDEIEGCKGDELTLKMLLNQFRFYYIENILNGTEYDFKYDIITLSIGNKSYIDSQFFDALQKLGIYHLYVISGTHVAFITGFLFFAFRKIRLTIQTIKWLLIIFLIMFLLFNFFSPSVFRAVFMAVTLLVTSMFRQKPYLTVISVSALIQIFYQPLIIYHAGFQLSYITTYFILLSRTFFEHVSPIKQLFGITIIAELSTIIIVIIQFNEISVSGIVMNSIFVPLFSFVIFPSVIIYNIAALLNIQFLLNDVLHIVFHWIKVLILFLGDSFKHRFPIRNMNEIVIILLIVMTYLMTRMLLLNQYKRMMVLIIPFVMIMYLNNKLQVDDFTVAMVDVGQGDAFIIEDHISDKVVMIDTGGRFYMDSAVIMQSEKNVLPYLKEQGIDQVDLMILSHMDIDHVGESAHIMSKINVKQLMVNGYDPKLDDWMAGIDNFKGEIIDSNTVRQFKVGNILLENLYDEYNTSIDTSNEYSIILRMNMNQFSFLMTGDMTSEMEREMIENNTDIRADVLKLAHHGSDSSSTSEFLDAVNYHVVLVSAGVDNRYNHPNSEVMERVGKAIIYSTQDDGMTRFNIRGDIMCIEGKLSEESKKCIKKDK